MNREQPPAEPGPDERLEARIVAWVLGEASDFEAGELERLCAERPELEAFRQSMAELHGLLRENAAPADDAAWKLSAEKRASVTRLAGAAQATARPARRAGYAALAIAACVAGVLAVRHFIALPSGRSADEVTEFAASSRAATSPGREAVSLDELQAQVRKQEEIVEERRKVMESIVRGRGLVYFGNDEDRQEHEQLAAEARDKLLAEKTELERAAKSLEELPDEESVRYAATLDLPENPVEEIYQRYLEEKRELADLAASGRGRRHPNVVSQAEVVDDLKERLDEGVTHLRSTLQVQLKMTDEKLRRFGVMGDSMAQNRMRGALSAVDYSEAKKNFEADQARLQELQQELFSRQLETSAGEMPALAAIEPAALPVEEAEHLRFRSAAAPEPEPQLGRPAVTYQYDLAAADEAIVGQARVPLDLAKAGNPLFAELGDEFRQAGALPAAETAATGASRSGQDFIPQQRFDDTMNAVDSRAVELEMNPDDELRRKVYLAEGYLNLGKVDEAKRAYQEALGIDPTNNAARRGMERVAAMQSDWYRAAYDHSRAELLMQVDQSWELSIPVPPADQPPGQELESNPADEPYSTFSLNVSDVSFRLAHAALLRGERPEPGQVKIEQFYNAVDYGDPGPVGEEKIAGVVEQSAHPVIPGRNLVRIGLKTAAVGRAANQPLRLTLLVDQSGSMVRDDRREALASAMAQLGKLLGPNDRVNVIGFSRTPRLLGESIAGDQAAKLPEIVGQAPDEGGTNLEEALALAAQVAARHQEAAAQNRIVLLTDGAANLGDADPARLAERVVQLRRQGIALDIAGVGTEKLNDELLAEMARKGDGRYYVVDGEDEAFAEQLAGALRPAAEDVKVQVSFNPERVAGYRLIGFEKDRLRPEDFRNDAVDAAELAADEGAVALYQIQPLPEGKGEIGEVTVRFRDPASGMMQERTWTIPHDPATPAFDRASPTMQLAGLALLAAEELRGGTLASQADLREFAPVKAAVREHFRGDPKVARVIEAIEALE